MRATSNNSLRIIHGGIRYLQSLNFLRTIESAKEQNKLLLEFPDFIKPLPCLMPLDESGLRGPAGAKLGAILYQLLTLRSDVLPKPKIVKRDFAVSQVPALSNLSNSHYMLWYDVLVAEPNLFSQVLIQELLMGGVNIFEGCSVTKIERKDEFFQISTRGGEKEKQIMSRAVVNAAGPWLNSVFCRGDYKKINQRRWAAGFNVVLNQQLESKYAFAVVGSCGRLYFAVPRGKRTVVGTGYFPVTADPSKVEVPEIVLGKFLDDFGSALSGKALTRNLVESIDIGVLPAAGFSGEEVKLVGRHKCTLDRGYGEILSTKYTTFQAQAARMASLLSKYLGKSATVYE